MNIPDILLLALIILVVLAAVRSMFKKRKTGECGCGCSDCGFSESCSAATPDRDHKL